MTKDAIMNYQFAERIKAMLLVGGMLFPVVEALKGQELDGAKKVLRTFFDTIAMEIALAIRVSDREEFRAVAEKLKLVQQMFERGDFENAQAMLGSAVKSATTACAHITGTLHEQGLL
jgi:tRNA U34 5-carboxymethylaminomethyl modifying GTPase MnmE/TrmE